MAAIVGISTHGAPINLRDVADYKGSAFSRQVTEVAPRASRRWPPYHENRVAAEKNGIGFGPGFVSVTPLIPLIPKSK
jgi:hypothetical protein